MLEDVISISTLMICTFLSTVVVAVFLTQSWLNDRSRPASGYWCLSMWVGSAGALLLAFRGIGNPLLSVGLGNGLVCFGYAFLWAGFRAFDGQRAGRLAILAGPAAWFISYALWIDGEAALNLRIALTSIIVAAYSLAIAFEVRRGGRKEILPARTITTILFATHALVFALRVPLALYLPADTRFGTGYSVWYAGFALETFLHTIAAAVAMVVLMKERGECVYRHAARTDALTGVLNRGAFLEETTARLARQPEAGTLLLLDLDHFKQINDTHGHIAGDRVLERFAAAVSARVGDTAIFGRFGGEEFALFAPALDLEEATAFADTLRRDVASLAVGHYGTLISFTVSIGLASAVLTGGDVDNLMAAADDALYRAKAEGRNRISVAGPAESLQQVVGRMRGPQTETGPKAIAG